MNYYTAATQLIFKSMLNAGKIFLHTFADISFLRSGNSNSEMRCQQGIFSKFFLYISVLKCWNADRKFKIGKENLARLNSSECSWGQEGGQD